MREKIAISGEYLVKGVQTVARSIAIASIGLALAQMLLAANGATAVTACLVDMKELAPRADTVVFGRIDAVTWAAAGGCTTPSPTELSDGGPRAAEQQVGSLRRPGESSRCEQLYVFEITVRNVLRGKTPKNVKVLVALPADPVALNCGDRPEIDDMAGWEAVLFLKTDQGQLRTLDGANSIYINSQNKRSAHRRLEAVRSLLNEKPYRSVESK